jgi:hypothetical protein
MTDEPYGHQITGVESEIEKGWQIAKEFQRQVLRLVLW